MIIIRLRFDICDCKLRYSIFVKYDFRSTVYGIRAFASIAMTSGYSNHINNHVITTTATTTTTTTSNNNDDTNNDDNNTEHGYSNDDNDTAMTSG